MGEEKKKLEIDISFGTSLKFWLAFLVVQIVAMIITFAIMLVAIGLMISTFQRIIPPTYPSFALIIDGIVK